MREIQINGKTFNLRSLTRKEIKGLKKFGFTYIGPNVSIDNIDEAMDAVFELVLTPEEIEMIDNIPNMEATKPIWDAVIAETYGSKAEEKN